MRPISGCKKFVQNVDINRMSLFPLQAGDVSQSFLYFFSFIVFYFTTFEFAVQCKSRHPTTTTAFLNIFQLHPIRCAAFTEAPQDGLQLFFELYFVFYSVWKIMCLPIASASKERFFPSSRYISRYFTSFSFLIKFH